MPFDMFAIEDFQDVLGIALPTFGKIDILVTGPYPNHEKKSVLELSDSELEDQFNGVTLPHMKLATHVARYMKASKIKGNIIFISSVMSRLIRTNSPGYDPGKNAINQFTKILAKTVAPNIRVNAILPGLTLTDGEHKHATRKEIEKWGKQLPMGRFALPIEVGYRAAFLASDLASAVTGSVDYITCGQHLVD